MIFVINDHNLKLKSSSLYLDAEVTDFLSGSVYAFRCYQLVRIVTYMNLKAAGTLQFRLLRTCKENWCTVSVVVYCRVVSVWALQRTCTLTERGLASSCKMFMSTILWLAS